MGDEGLGKMVAQWTLRKQKEDASGGSREQGKVETSEERESNERKQGKGLLAGQPGERGPKKHSV